MLLMSGIKVNAYCLLLNLGINDTATSDILNVAWAFDYYYETLDGL